MEESQKTHKRIQLLKKIRAYFDIIRQEPQLSNDTENYRSIVEKMEGILDTGVDMELINQSEHDRIIGYADDWLGEWGA